jgi:hypothetical protein
MAQKKKRAKNEPTKGDLLAQQYRNRAAMRRVFEASTRSFGCLNTYWTPRNMDAWEVR